MLKLAVVVDTFPRWSERFVARELSELKRRKVDFDVFCLASGRLPGAETASGCETEWQGLLERRIVLPATFSAKAMAAALGRLPKLKASLYAKVRPDISDELGLMDLLRLARARALEAALIKGKYGHVHAHFAGLTSSVAWLAAKAAHLPLSISVHARDLFVEPQLLTQKLSDCARIFTCHEHARLHLLGKATTEADSVRYRDRVLLMRHGLPLEHFAFKSRNGHSGRQRPLRILAAGRLVPKKGFEHLIDALDHSSLAGRDIRLTLLGEGPEAKSLRQRIRSMKRKKIVSLVPPLTGGELRDAFANSDVFVAPYQKAADGDVDGVPNVVLEAFALGLPVIGTTAGGLREILNAETGRPVPPGSAEALADALVAVMEAPKEAQRRAKCARGLIERDYNIRKNIMPLMALFS